MSLTIATLGVPPRTRRQGDVPCTPPHLRLLRHGRPGQGDGPGAPGPQTARRQTRRDGSSVGRRRERPDAGRVPRHCRLLISIYRQVDLGVCGAVSSVVWCKLRPAGRAVGAAVAFDVCRAIRMSSNSVPPPASSSPGQRREGGNPLVSATCTTHSTGRVYPHWAAGS